jgi:uroporphyrinogen decarboxylase
MPIGVYAGLEITGASIKDAVTNSQAQSEAVLALHERFQTDVLLTAMDLSAESELFGCEIHMDEDEIPTVIGRLVTTAAEIEKLAVPIAGEGRTAVHLQTAQKLVAEKKGIPVMGGVIGPFSLAGRLFGVSESMELSISDPEMLEALLTKVTRFLTDYVWAFRQVGAAGIIMAEPAAGLLSPRGLGRFSSPFIRQIIEANQAEDFTIILHNCGAKIAHLPRILEAGAEIFHFGAPMDISLALEQVDRSVILAGNLDPSAVFHGGTPDEVREKTGELLQRTAIYQNFIISSGCDIPPHTPVENLDAFYQTVRGLTG